jgi:hypothetical protein
MKRYWWLWPTITIFSTIAVGFVNFLSREIVLRPIIVMWFLLVCPGMMLVRFLRLSEPVVEWTLALALSISIDAIVAGIQVYAGLWSPTATLVILICLCLGGSFIQIAIPRSVG